MVKRRRPVRTAPVGQKPKPRPKGRTVTLSRPPAGTYDVQLDADERAAKRGYGNTLEDVLRSRERGATDFGLGQADIQRQQGEVNRQYGESLSDLIRSRTQGQQDYGTNIQTIARNFSRLGNNQAQQGRRAGLGSGFQAQAQRKRAANEQIERAPVDLGFQRFLEGSKLAETRLGEAKQRGLDEVSRSGGQLNLGYERGEEDLGVTERRAGTEFQNYLQDVSAARQAQYGGPLPKVTLPASRPTGNAAEAAFRRSQTRARSSEAAALARARRRAKNRRI
jgi:hypothetical protein